MHTVSGRVVDALHGIPVSHALVHLNARSVLADSQGRFAFAQFGDSQAYVSVTKPGYAPSQDASDGPAMIKVADLDAPLALSLYPDAVLTGTLTARDGSPLAGIGVQLFRANFEAEGLTAAQVRFTVTDSHGNYRFQEPAGLYRVATRYLGSDPETGQAFLPAAFPTGSSTSISGFEALQSGEEKRVSLRAVTGIAVPVQLHVDGMRTGEDRARLRLFVETSGDAGFATQAQGGTAPGEYRMTLPPGSYTIRATSGDREDPLAGSAHISVTAHGTNVVQMHLYEAASLPIEIAVASNPSTASASQTQTAESAAPTVAQLGLALRNLAPPADAPGELRPRGTADAGYSFRVPPGRYRLVMSGSNAWNILSASLGTANLIGSEINIAPGSAGTPIRLLVGNATGQITGTVKLGSAPSCWLYMLSREPSLVPFYLERVGATGTFSRSVPVGSYTLLAVEHRIQADLQDRSVLQALAAGGQQVDVTAGGKASLDVTLEPTAGGER